EAAAVDVGAVAAVCEVTVGVDEESLAIVAADVQVGAPAERRADDRSAAGRTVVKRAGRDEPRRAIVRVTLQRAERVGDDAALDRVAIEVAIHPDAGPQIALAKALVRLL